MTLENQNGEGIRGIGSWTEVSGRLRRKERVVPSKEGGREMLRGEDEARFLSLIERGIVCVRKWVMALEKAQ